MNSSHSPSKASSQQLPALDTNGRSHCPLPATRGRKLFEAFSATWKPCPNTLLTGSFAVVISPAYEDVREDNGRRLADDDERFKQERGKVFGDGDGGATVSAVVVLTPTRFWRRFCAL